MQSRTLDPAFSKTMPQAIPWDALRAEPYRLMFPLGTAGACIGIGIWIAYYLWPHAVAYPGQGHAVIQIQGFLLCFILGFLTTMLPKVLGVPPLGPLSFALFPILIAGIIAAALAGAPLAAQVLHLAVLANFAAFAALRYPRRKADPPPFFLFIALGFLADAAGALIKIFGLSTGADPAALRIGALLQFQAFPLLMILGVGGFLLPKLLAQGAVDPKTLRAQAGKAWKTPAILCALFTASFAIEILGIVRGFGEPGIRAAYALRAAVWIWFLFLEMRIQKTQGKLQPYLRSARISLVVMAAAMVMPVFRPAYMLAWEHVLFLSGFLRLTLSIASRVMAAHAGRMEVLGLHGRKVRIYGMLIVFSMITRIATEMRPDGHWLHLAIAAGLALWAIYIWGRLYMPLLWIIPRRGQA